MKHIYILLGIFLLLLASCSISDENVKITPSFTEAIHQYDELYPFSEGMAAVRKDGKFGYINTKGELIIPCQYAIAGPFKEGRALAMENYEVPISFIDKEGKAHKTTFPFDTNYYMGMLGDGYIDSGLQFDHGVCEIHYSINEEPQIGYFLKDQMQKIQKPQEDNSETEKVVDYEIFSIQSSNIYGDDIELHGLKNKSGEIIIPAKYYRLQLCDNAVVLGELYVESAESYGQYKPVGLSIFGYIDLKGNSTFTDADMEKIEKYKTEQMSAMIKLKEEELEEQRRLEERRRLGSDIIITLSSDFTSDKNYLTNYHGTIGDRVISVEYHYGAMIGNRLRTSIRVEYGKKLQFKSYKNKCIHSEWWQRESWITVYSEDGRFLSEHSLNNCGDFTVFGGQYFRLSISGISSSWGRFRDRDYSKDPHFEMQFIFKEYEE